MKNKLLSILLIAGLGILIYSNSFLCSFHFDDNPSIVDNPLIKNIRHLQDIWVFWPCRFVTDFSFALNYHFHQLNVFGYHLFNLTVHLLTAILVWWLTLLTLSTPIMKEQKISRHSDLIALFAGLIFVSHPLQTQAVTYIVQRAASMATLFYLASLCFYIKSRVIASEAKQSLKKIAASPAAPRNDTKIFYYLCSLLTAILAMFTKEITITLPLMILLYEYSFLKTGDRMHWKHLSPFLPALLVIPLIMFFTKSVNFQEAHRMSEGPAGISSMHYFLTQLRVMVTYIRLVFLPVKQNLDYDYSISKSIFELPVLLDLLFLTMVLFLAKRLFLKFRLVSFSIWWFFLTLLPESSFLPLQDIIYEHRLYLPMVGFSIFLASGVYYLFEKNTIKTMVVILTVIVACNSVLTYQRNKVWKDEISLWEDVAHKSPHKARAYNNLGCIFAQQSNFVLAGFDFNKAIEIDPGYADAYNNRGNMYSKQGSLKQAISDFNKAIAIKPKFIRAYYNRGIAFARQGNYNQALSNYNVAIGAGARDADVYNDRGYVYGIQGHLTQAISDFNKAIEIDPNNAEARKNLAVCKTLK